MELLIAAKGHLQPWRARDTQIKVSHTEQLEALLLA
jgi:hypothetical protein